MAVMIEDAQAVLRSYNPSISIQTTGPKISLLKFPVDLVTLEDREEKEHGSDSSKGPAVKKRRAHHQSRKWSSENQHQVAIMEHQGRTDEDIELELDRKTGGVVQ